jgi:putative phosphoribosyl transferase
MLSLPFEDRTEAGRKLACELVEHRIDDAIVLGLTRGGVPVAFALADRLRLPLDFIVVRKIGVPWQPELAMGALAGAALILDHPMIEELGIAEEEVQAVIAREEEEAQSREVLYRRGAPSPDFAGKTVILVDDGLATGSTMVAAMRHARSLKALKIIVAAPVASAYARQRLRTEAEDVICLAVPEHFIAVGEWYRNFDQVSDREVTALLAANETRLKSYRNHSSAA